METSTNTKSQPYLLMNNERKELFYRDFPNDINDEKKLEKGYAFPLFLEIPSSTLKYNDITERKLTYFANT